MQNLDSTCCKYRLSPNDPLPRPAHPLKPPGQIPTFPMNLSRSTFLLRYRTCHLQQMAVGQNPVPLINIKIGGTCMFIRPKMEPYVVTHDQIGNPRGRYPPPPPGSLANRARTLNPNRVYRGPGGALALRGALPEGAGLAVDAA